MANQYVRGNIVMGSKDLGGINNYADLHLQQLRRLYITVEVLDKDNFTIETIEGLATGGSINVSNSSLIRRTGTLSFVLFDELLPRQNSMLWMTNKIRVYAGLEDSSKADGNITNFCLGTFYITEPAIDISRDSRTISINLEDNMMRWGQEELENKLRIEAGTPLNSAVVSLMNFYGEFNISVGFTDLKVPYTLEFNEGETVIDILAKLRDLYMDWECFYDTDGTFVFRQMKIQREDGEPVAWTFEKSSDLITIFRESFTYKEVKNRIVVIGAMDEKTGLTPKAEVKISLEDSPFHESSIGTKTRVIVEGSYGNALQCDSRARYELFKQSTFQEKATINTIPIYYLDANDLIEVVNYATGERERYVIDSIGIGLTIEEEMALTCHKVYYNHFPVTSSIGEYQESADIIIDGITNKGWLALSESRAIDYLGLSGDGSKLIVRFEYEGIHGTTAYTTAYTADSTQSITIDLADFDHVTGDSGANGNGKEEYSDRILGHEMVHVVMNNALGVNKSIVLPNWFKEGVAEYIHGADERLKISIVENGAISSTKLTAIVNRAVELLNGATFQSISDDYSAGYLIVKYLDEKLALKNGNTMKNLMWSIQTATGTTDLLKNAIVDTTNFVAYSDFVSDVSANLYDYVMTSIHLNLTGDEADTGSIEGLDGDGTANLNAENVFDNSKAVMGQPAINFAVEFIRP